MGQDDFLLYYQDQVGKLTQNPLAMIMINMTTYPIIAPYPYQPRWGVANGTWPPKGLHLEITFAPPGNSNTTGKFLPRISR